MKNHVYLYNLSNNTHNNIYEHSIMKIVFNKYKLALIPHSVTVRRNWEKKSLFDASENTEKQQLYQMAL